MKSSVTPLPNGLALHEYRLSNGLRLLIVPNRFAPVFLYQTVYFVGSRFERPGKHGLAHLFEHMMFRETTMCKAGEFDRRMTQMGAQDLNAYTSTDRTVYYESLPAEFLEETARLEADRMVNIVIDQARLDEERGAVIGEYHMYLNDPGFMFYKTMCEMLFSAHPYRHEVIGTEPEIRSFSIEDCMDFYRAFYAPNNAAVLIVGDVEPEAASRVIERHYGGIKAAEIATPAYPPEPKRAKRKIKAVAHPFAAQTEIGAAVTIPTLTEADLPYWLILEILLSEQTFSLAYDRLVRAGLATGVRAGVDIKPRSEPSIFYLSATVAPSVKPAAIQRAVQSLFARLRGRYLSQRMLKMAASQIKLHYFVESNIGLANLISSGLNYADDPMFAFRFFYERFLKLKLSPRALRDVARRYFAPSRQNILFLTPGGEANRSRKNHEGGAGA